MFAVPKDYVYTAPHVTNSGSSASTEYLIQTNTISNQNAKNNFDMDININDESRSFATPRKIVTVPLNQALKLIFLAKLIFYLIHFNIK